MLMVLITWLIVVIALACFVFVCVSEYEVRKRIKQRRLKSARYLWQLRKTKRIKKRGNTVLFVVR